MVEELKLKIGVEYTPKMQGVLRVKKWLKRFGYIWLILTIWMTISLVIDARQNPELWHIVAEGFTGEQLRAFEDAEPGPFSGNSFDFGNFSDVAGVGTIGDDLKYKYPDWVYEIRPESSYKHFYDVVIWPVGPWILLTFLFMGVKLRVSLWEIENLRGDRGGK